MIVQIRGSMGAGKSTLVRQLLLDYGGEQVDAIALYTAEGQESRKIGVWRCRIPGDLFVLGNYKLLGPSPGSGSDGLYGPDQVRVLSHYAKFGHVLHEGARNSAQRQLPWLGELLALPLVWAVLDTPFEECVRRIHQRRAERGRNVGTPLNMRALRWQHGAVPRYAQEGAAAGIRTVTLDHRDPFEELQKLFGYVMRSPVAIN